MSTCNSSQELVQIEEELVVKALEVYRNVPSWSVNYTQADALRSVGLGEKAGTDRVQRRFERLLQGWNDYHGRPDLENDTESNVDRAVYLAQRIVINPVTRKKASLAYAMEVAGLPKDKCQASAERMKVTRRLKKATKDAPTPTTTGQAELQGAPVREVRVNTNEVRVNTNNDQDRRASLVSPLSSATTTGFGSASSPPRRANTETLPRTNGTEPVPNTEDDDAIQLFNLPPELGPSPASVIAQLMFGDNYNSNSSAVDSVPVISIRDARKAVGRNINGPISHLTTSKTHRRTTEAAQAERQSKREIENIRRSMHKVGSVMYKAVSEGALPLKKLASSEAVAKELNALVGIDCLSGRELATAVRNGQAGQSPPRLGRSGEVPLADFKDFCQLVFTCCAIEQANASGERLNREQLKTAVGEILNGKRTDENKDPMNDSAFYARVEAEICHLQDLAKADNREALRVYWLTYQTQLKHYQNWEKTVVELGFARELNETETVQDDGYVVWKEHRKSYLLQFDEINFALDGTDASIGGRPSRIPTTNAFGLQDSGSSKDKSAASLTVMCGVNFAGEALPPLFIFPSKAQPKNYKIRTDFMASLPQLEARYGFSRTRCHNVPFAMNAKGGMTKEMLHLFFTHCVLPLYPECADDPEHCLLSKMDSGPGRNNPEMLVDIRARGAHLHPGLPNGTEIGQELDQMFALLRKLTLENRDALWKARFRLEGETACLSMGDVAAIFFGGTVMLTDGSEIELQPAWEMAMDPTHIKEAMDKCGYCPSTRAALKASQIRHQAIEDQDGSIDTDADPYGALLDELERQNHSVVNDMKEKGYRLADTLSRKIRRVTAEQIRGREAVVTAPNTRERQDAIMGMSTAGGWFHITNGGAPMTCDDALISNTRKKMMERATQLEKRREKALKGDTCAVEAASILEEKPLWSDWTKEELKNMIRWKQSALPQKEWDNVNVNKPVLMALWTDKYEEIEATTGALWTEDDEKELEHLQSGEITDFLEDTGIKRCQDTEDEYLVTRLLAVATSRRQKIIENVLDRIDGNERSYFCGHMDDSDSD